MKTQRAVAKRVRRRARENWGLSPEDIRTLRSLNTPARIQKFVDSLTYQYADTAGLRGVYCGIAKGIVLKARWSLPVRCASTDIRRC